MKDSNQTWIGVERQPPIDQRPPNTPFYKVNGSCDLCWHCGEREHESLLIAEILIKSRPLKVLICEKCFKLQEGLGTPISKI